MEIYFNAEHPKDVLVFYIATQPQSGDEEKLGPVIDAMETERNWIIGPPRFIHQTEDVVDPRTGRPVVTLGGFHEVYSAYPPWRDILPPSVDLGHYEECALIVSRIAAWSESMGRTFHWEFNGEMIGEIAAGRLDDRLEQFLGVWRRGLRPSF